jgi:hypothetical protein
VIAIIDTHATIEVLEAVFSVRSVQLHCKSSRATVEVFEPASTRTYGTVFRRQLKEQEVDVRRPPACEDMSPGAEKCLLLEGVSKQNSEDRD